MEPAGASAEQAGLDFEALGLNPGATMQIQAVADTPQPHHWVKYVGCISKSSVLTTLPVEDGKGMWIQTGQTFVVRGFNGRYAYAFTSQMIRARAHPFAYLHFSWPHSIESQVVRHSQRVDVVLPVNVLLADNSSISTTLIDVSISGAMLDSPLSIGAAGDKVHVELSINLDGNAVRMNIPAIIRNVHANEGGEGFNTLTGVEFNDISQNDRLILNYFIDSVSQAG
jgi:c-di-GMP-binding flagellar brake protein YcgR